MDGRFELAQLNVGRLVAPVSSPQIAGFVAELAPVNAIADQAPGFVWRLQTEAGDATSIRPTQDDLFLINMSVWESIDALHAFTYRSDHRTVFARRFEWFERADGPNVVLWWVPAGTIPSPDEALGRLRLLAERGPTPDAFGFKSTFPPPDEDVAVTAALAPAAEATR